VADEFLPDASNTERQTREAKREIEKLRQEVDYLTLVVQSLWSLLKEKSELQDSQLMSVIKEFDLKDGRLNNRPHREPQLCPKCNRALSVESNNCLYCGDHYDRTSPF